MQDQEFSEYVCLSRSRLREQPSKARALEVTHLFAGGGVAALTAVPNTLLQASPLLGIAEYGVRGIMGNPATRVSTGSPGVSAAMKHHILGLAVAVLLSACGDQAITVDAAGPLQQAEIFQPDNSPHAWVTMVAQEVEHYERRLMLEGSRYDHRWGAPGMQTGAPDVAVRFSGGMNGGNRFTGFIEGEMRNNFIFSNTPRALKVQEYEIRASTGWRTNSDDCRRQIHDECKNICRERRYESDGAIILLFAVLDRADECHTRDQMFKTSDSGRAQWCDVYEIHPNNCQGTEGSTPHPIQDCVYHNTTTLTHWSTPIECVLDGAWHCTQGKTSIQCDIVASPAGVAVPPAYCEVTRNFLTGGNKSAKGWRGGRISRIQESFSRHFQP